MGVVEPGISTIERELTGALGAWATGSVVIGGALAVVGRMVAAPVVRGFARQQIGWGAIDGAIAAIGAARSRGRTSPALALVGPEDGPSEADIERARRLERVLTINTALDVVYVGSGIALAATAEPAARRWRRDRYELVGDGLGIVVQGGFLLALDAFFLRRVRRFRRADA